jgi:hypothetical protein
VEAEVDLGFREGNQKSVLKVRAGKTSDLILFPDR